MSQPEQARASIGDELEAARREVREGAVAAAAARLEALRGRAPDDPRVAAGLARAYLRQGRVDAALSVARDAVARAPTAAVALVALGQARKAAHDLEGALEAFDRARAVDDTPFVGTQLGRAQLALGRAEEALATARTAQRRHGRDAALLELEGDALQRLGRREEAIAVYEAARALKPEDPLAEKRLLEARLRELPLDEALLELARLLQVPSYAGRAFLHELHGRFLHDAGRFADAAAAFARVLAADPGASFARRLLGFAAWKAGDAAGAVQALRPLFLADPHDTYVRTTLLAAWARLGRGDEARAALTEALAAHPEAKGLYGALRRLGRQAGAGGGGGAADAAAATDGDGDSAPAPTRKPRAARRRPPRGEQLDLGVGPARGPREPDGR